MTIIEVNMHLLNYILAILHIPVSDNVLATHDVAGYLSNFC